MTYLKNFEAPQWVILFLKVLTGNAIFIYSFIFSDPPFIPTIIYGKDVVTLVIFSRVLTVSL
jgi:hypothetical protein